MTSIYSGILWLLVLGRIIPPQLRMPGNVLVYMNNVLITDFGTAVTGVSSRVARRLEEVVPTLPVTPLMRL